MRLLRTVLLSAAMLLAACGGNRRGTTLVGAPYRLTSILVEVYDPVTNLAWENVSVRIVEADQEWSGCTCVCLLYTSPSPRDRQKSRMPSSA